MLGRPGAGGQGLRPGLDGWIGCGGGSSRALPAGDVTDISQQGHADFDFRLLGPLDVRFAGAPLELARAKGRALLGMLLLRVNEVVSLDHLAAGLWEEAEGPRPPATLRVHMSRLRQALAAAGMAGEAVVVTSGRGYSLTVPCEAVDAWRFEQLAAAGRQQLSTGDAPGAAGSLRQALALWRGAVLADLSF